VGVGHGRAPSRVITFDPRQTLFPRQRGAACEKTAAENAAKPCGHLSNHFQWGPQVLISAAFFYSQTAFTSTPNLLISLIFFRVKS
jgi:hypothetical protein